MSWLALDVGGANIKLADGRGWARTQHFPLWREPEGLAGVLVGLLDAAPRAERLAVTMTGELCDCFRTKDEGVAQIIGAIVQAAGQREVFVYLVDGRIVGHETARALPNLVAASNWHVLACFACRFLKPRAGVLIDTGSTTTDIIPLANGQPAPSAFNDTVRLLSGELLYTGVVRTPVCAITRWLPWRGMRCPVAAEVFATAADAYVILEKLPEQHVAAWTADGRGLTKGFARDRLARMICADGTTFSESDARNAAEVVREAQAARLRAALEQVLGRMSEQPEQVLLSGEGEFLAAEVIQLDLPLAKVFSLAEILGPDISRAAPAHALAVIAVEKANSGGLGPPMPPGTPR